MPNTQTRPQGQQPRPQGQNQRPQNPRGTMYEKLGSAYYGNKTKRQGGRPRVDSIKDPAPSPSKWIADGVDHINIWERGTTELGRALSHGSRIKLTHDIFGKFSSMESFWYYMQSEERDDRMRNMSGQTLRSFARKMTPARIINFRAIIMDSNYQRIKANKPLAADLAKSTLPFECYFIGKDSDVRIRPNYFKWMIAGFDEIRTALAANREPDFTFLLDRINNNEGIYAYVMPVQYAAPTETEKDQGAYSREEDHHLDGASSPAPEWEPESTVEQV